MVTLLRANSQGYFNLGTSALIQNKTMNNSITMGAGYRLNKLSAGITTDMYGIDKSKGRFGTAAFDFRGYLFKKNSPYLSVQPGYTLYDKFFDHIHIRGSYAIAAVVGYEFKPKEVGFNLSVGWQYTSFKTLGVTSRSNSLKVNLSIAL